MEIPWPLLGINPALAESDVALRLRDANMATSLLMINGLDPESELELYCFLLGARGVSELVCAGDDERFLARCVEMADKDKSEDDAYLDDQDPFSDADAAFRMAHGIGLAIWEVMQRLAVTLIPRGGLVPTRQDPPRLEIDEESELYQKLVDALAGAICFSQSVGIEIIQETLLPYERQMRHVLGDGLVFDDLPERQFQMAIEIMGAVHAVATMIGMVLRNDVPERQQLWAQCYLMERLHLYVLVRMPYVTTGLRNDARELSEMRS